MKVQEINYLQARVKGNGLDELAGGKKWKNQMEEELRVKQRT